MSHLLIIAIIILTLYYCYKYIGKRILFSYERRDINEEESSPSMAKTFKGVGIVILLTLIVVLWLYDSMFIEALIDSEEGDFDFKRSYYKDSESGAMLEKTLLSIKSKNMYFFILNSA